MYHKVPLDETDALRFLCRDNLIGQNMQYSNPYFFSEMEGGGGTLPKMGRGCFWNGGMLAPLRTMDTFFGR